MPMALLKKAEYEDQFYDDKVKSMLVFPGFQKAEVGKEKAVNHHELFQTKLTVRYTLGNEQDLEKYFNNHAKKMREDGIRRFGNQFSATRRVFTESVLVE